MTTGQPGGRPVPAATAVAIPRRGYDDARWRGRSAPSGTTVAIPRRGYDDPQVTRRAGKPPSLGLRSLVGAMTTADLVAARVVAALRLRSLVGAMTTTGRWQAADDRITCCDPS